MAGTSGLPSYFVRSTPNVKQELDWGAPSGIVPERAAPQG